MTDATSSEICSSPVDLEHAARPDAAAFRLIAAAMGARYAGDDVTAESGPAEATEAGADPVALPQEGDERLASLLERLPLPIFVVTSRGGIVFVNRAARDVLGHDTADDLDAAGGLGSVFAAGSGRNGAIVVTTASGATFEARAEMKPIDWADHRAMMVTLEPLTPAREDGPQPAADGDSLARELLDANPDPAALITRGGHVDIANAAYVALAPGASPALAERLDPAALGKVLRLAGEAFERNAIAVADDIMVAGRPMAASVGPVGDMPLACLVFRAGPARLQPIGADGADEADAGAAAGPGDAVESAVIAARALLREANVSINFAGTAPLALAEKLHTETERFFRAVLVALGARAASGAAITLERGKAGYWITLTPAAPDALSEIDSSQRLVLFGLEAGLAVTSTGDGRIAIAPLLGAAPAGELVQAPPSPA